jgi:glucose-6-phosphate 1-dehydrogenase
MRSVDMEFKYRDSFSGVLPDAYERLLMEALRGDASLFTRSDGIETAWKLVDSIASGWETRNIPDLALYRRGSWGPSEANTLLARDERSWRLGCVGE